MRAHMQDQQYKNTEFKRNMVWVGAKDKQKIYLHIAQFPPLCYWVLSYRLHCSNICAPPYPNTLGSRLTVTKSSEVKNCCYPSFLADELRMERIWTKARRSPQVGRAELRHIQNPSRLMYLRVCRKPHFC